MASLLDPVDDLGRTIDVAPFLDRLRAQQPQADPIWPVSNPIGTERLVDYRGWDRGPPSPTLPPDPLSTAIAPAPNTEYGSVLPIARDTMTGDWRWALPSALREQLQGVYDLTQGPRTGEVTPEGTMSLLASVDPLARPQEGLLGSLRSPPRELPEPQAGRLSVPADNPSMVSTRLVSNQTPYDVHQASDAIINLDAMRADPETFAKNMATLKDYPNFPPSRVRSPDSIAQRMQDLIVGNLGWLKSLVPQGVQDLSTQWYRGAHGFINQLGDQYGISPHATAGVTAALSPQKDWNMNADMSHRLINIWTQQQDTPATAAMVDFARNAYPREDMSWMQGSRLTDLQDDPMRAAAWVRAFDETTNPQQFRLQSPTPTDEPLDFARNQDGTPTQFVWQNRPNIAKAIRILQDDSIPNISRNLGNEHKVRNFYNNLIDPDNVRGDVTIDTHQIAGNLLFPIGSGSPLAEQGMSGSSPAPLIKRPENYTGPQSPILGGTAYSGETGASGMYGLHADAVRQAAQEADLLPREMQSLSWEAIRSMFTPAQRRNKELLGNAIDIWQNYGAGRISADDARNQILDLANLPGGQLRDPIWYQPGGANRLPAVGVGSAGTGGVGSGAGGAAAEAPTGLVAPGGGAGISPAMGPPNLPGVRPATRLLRLPGYADGGLIDGPPTGAAPIAGYIPPTTPAGIDSLAAPLPQGGAVLPAPAMSLLGGGNAQRGARHLDRHLPPPAKRAGAATMGRVSPGEYVVHPNQLGNLLSLLGGVSP
jgi:hypothetical protein